MSNLKVLQALSYRSRLNNYKQYRDFIYKYIFHPDNSKRVFRILSIRRSGQHAIINWIKEQEHRNILFFNNVLQGKSVFDSSNKQETRFLPWVRGKTLLYNIENPVIESLGVELGLGGYTEFKNIILIRDPFNCFASYYNATWSWGNPFRSSQESRDYLIMLWKELAKEYLGLTNQIQNKVLVNYNQWVTSIDYRKSLIKQLDLKSTDKGFDVTPDYGSGSSFNSGSKDYFNRWETCKDDVWFIQAFKDTELLDLSNAIFGYVEGTENI